MKKLLVLILVFSTLLMADDVILKNGTVYKNVKIVGDVGTKVQLKTSFGLVEVEASQIEKIVSAPYDEKIPSLEIKPPKKQGISDIRYFTVPLAVVGGYFAYSSFKKVSDLEKDIERANKNNESAKDLITKKNTSTALGVVFSAVAIVSIYFTIEPFQISASPNKLSLFYKF